jgi:hypothetical protein
LQADELPTLMKYGTEIWSLFDFRTEDLKIGNTILETSKQDFVPAGGGQKVKIKQFIPDNPIKYTRISIFV